MDSIRLADDSAGEDIGSEIARAGYLAQVASNRYQVTRFSDGEAGTTGSVGGGVRFRWLEGMKFHGKIV
jgi:hypothetical protein